MSYQTLISVNFTDQECRLLHSFIHPTFKLPLTELQCDDATLTIDGQPFSELLSAQLFEMALSLDPKLVSGFLGSLMELLGLDAVSFFKLYLQLICLSKDLVPSEEKRAHLLLVEGHLNHFCFLLDKNELTPSAKNCHHCFDTFAKNELQHVLECYDLPEKVQKSNLIAFKKDCRTTKKSIDWVSKALENAIKDINQRCKDLHVIQKADFEKNNHIYRTRNTNVEMAAIICVSFNNLKIETKGPKNGLAFTRFLRSYLSSFRTTKGLRFNADAIRTECNRIMKKRITRT